MGDAGVSQAAGGMGDKLLSVRDEQHTPTLRQCPQDHGEAHFGFAAAGRGVEQHPAVAPGKRGAEFGEGLLLIFPELNPSPLARETETWAWVLMLHPRSRVMPRQSPRPARRRDADYPSMAGGGWAG